MIPFRDDNPTYTVPYINYLLIIVNVIVFLFEVLTDFSDSIFINYAMIPSVFWHRPFSNFYRIFTSMFIHASWLHIIGNMLFLWIFGDNIEDVLGHFRYLFFYIASGICGALLQSILSAHSSIPMVGASGAISGVIAAYLIFFPRVKIDMLLFFFIKVRLPAIFYLLIWIITQLFNGFGSLTVRANSGGIAYFAHIGGIAFGLIYAAKKGNTFKRKWQEKIKINHSNRKTSG